MKDCNCDDGEMCWRCTPYGRDPRDPQWQDREALRIVLAALASEMAREHYPLGESLTTDEIVISKDKP